MKGKRTEEAGRLGILDPKTKGRFRSITWWGGLLRAASLPIAFLLIEFGYEVDAATVEKILTGALGVVGFFVGDVMEMSGRNKAAQKAATNAPQIVKGLW